MRLRFVLVLQLVFQSLFLAQALLHKDAQAAVETFIGRPADPAGRPGRAARRASDPKPPGGRFKQLDSNRDGRVSRQEMEEGNRARLNAFARADSNADGHLSKEEWRAYQGKERAAKAGGDKAASAKGRKRSKTQRTSANELL